MTSVNQLSIYEAVADLCKELSKDSEVVERLAANEDLESMEIPTGLICRENSRPEIIQTVLQRRFFDC